MAMGLFPRDCEYDDSTLYVSMPNLHKTCIQSLTSISLMLLTYYFLHFILNWYFILLKHAVKTASKIRLSFLEHFLHTQCGIISFTTLVYHNLYITYGYWMNALSIL